MSPENKALLLFAILFLHGEISCLGKSCELHSLFDCGKNEMCSQNSIDSNTGVCKCKTGFQRQSRNSICTLIPTSESKPIVNPSGVPLPPESSQQSSTSAATIIAGVLIPLSVLAVSGLMYIAHRYKWLQQLQNLHMRRYDEVHIGHDDDDDDDPPLQ